MELRILMLWLWVMIVLGCAYGCWEEERVALLQLKASFNLANGTGVPDWGNTTTAAASANDCCLWAGVECDTTTRRVIGLDLGSAMYNALGNWYLNVSMFLPFKSLRNLDLAFVGIAGLVENEGFEKLSPKLRNQLEVLDLSWNYFSNSILASLSGLSSLRILDLGYNLLNGSFPQGLCELKSLQEINLSGNDLVGSLPWCLTNLTSLEVLAVYDNKFTGNIASSPLVNLTSLVGLTLSSNHFKVPISFQSFFNHSRLKSIDCLDNELLVETGDKFQTSIPSFQLSEIYLSNKAGLDNLTGAFPNFLYHQRNLSLVSLSGIDFGGKFPNWLLENNTVLDYLFLGNNSFSEPLLLPSHLVSRLSSLSISNNYFSGRIPENIATFFPDLNVLDMSKNGFSGGIPSSFGDMKSLAYLDLSHNQLSGKIPSHLAMGCYSLYALMLSNNNLEGPILPSPNNLTSLSFLEMEFNQFTEIPPDGFSNCSSLLDLVVSHNRLEHPIPTSICQLQRLWLLDLSDNNITGFIPDCFSPPEITVVRLSKNRLQGFSNTFYNKSYLTVLDLSHNLLTGSIPNWISSLPGLNVLLLKDNHFDGEIPIQLCHLSHLGLIDLSDNNLSGRIPSCLDNISFQEISYDINDWSTFRSTIEFTTKKSALPYKLQAIQKFTGLDLSSNKLTGNIPPGIGNLSQIKVLNLSHNSLSGMIPNTFFDLKQIESLDLSANKLEGEIPPQLSQLDYLAVFNVSYNNLSGRIPQGPHFLTFDRESYFGNPLLCGEPILRSCTITEPRATNGDEEDNDFIDMDTFYVSFAVAYITILLGTIVILYINPYWRQAWFRLVEVCVTCSYYFVVDNFPKVFSYGKQ